MFWVYYPPFPFGEDSSEFSEGIMPKEQCETDRPTEVHADKLPEEEWLITSILRGLVSMAFLSFVAAMYDRGHREE